MRQVGRRAWLCRNATLLRLGSDPEDRLYAGLPGVRRLGSRLSS
ncbi:MAG: hypothetical protein ACRDP7_44895 [Trebonia sp.]